MGMFYIEQCEIATSVAQKMVQYWQFHEIRANKKKKKTERIKLFQEGFLEKLNLKGAC